MQPTSPNFSAPMSSFTLFVWIWIGVACLTFLSLFSITAPYGRHQRTGWGITIDNRLGWILMEVVSPLTLLFFFLTGSQPKSTVVWVLVGLWVLHYINRSLIFPFRLRTDGKRMPLSIALMAVFFNLVNGFTNGYYWGHIAESYSDAWLTDWRFIIGLGVFIAGAFVNIQSDEILLRLRENNPNTYKIPQGGLYGWISSPNYFGEMVEWLGFALMAWSLPALAFALWTIANLFPRAIANHQWYLSKFTDYPAQRKAVIPFIW